MIIPFILKKLMEMKFMIEIKVPLLSPNCNNVTIDYAPVYPDAMIL